MSDTPTAATDPDGDRLVYASWIRADIGLAADRSLRRWIVQGKFPRPDTNIHGRNAWKLTTYLAWRANMMAGALRQDRRPRNPREPTAA